MKNIAICYTSTFFACLQSRFINFNLRKDCDIIVTKKKMSARGRARECTAQWHQVNYEKANLKESSRLERKLLWFSHHGFLKTLIQLLSTRAMYIYYHTCGHKDYCGSQLGTLWTLWTLIKIMSGVISEIVSCHRETFQRILLGPCYEKYVTRHQDQWLNRRLLRNPSLCPFSRFLWKKYGPFYI